MLTRIVIQNFALIESLDISLDKGLQVITGETGAGKSIILGALRLIMGERAEQKSILDEKSKSVVEAYFWIDNSLESFFQENDLDFENETIIRREILPSGKTRAFVNDVPVTLDILKELSRHIIDIHSQFETVNLFTEGYQFSIIDTFAGNQKYLDQYQKEYLEFQNRQKELDKLLKQREDYNKDQDYKSFLLSELEEMNLDELDLEELETKVSTLENADMISENLSQIFQRFDQEEVGVLDGLLSSRSKLSKVASLSHEFTHLEQRFEENFLELKDILFELQNKSEQIDSNQELLDKLQKDLSKINSLMVKHQVDSLPSLIRVKDELLGEQTGIEELDDFILQTRQELEKSVSDLNILAEKLSLSRNKAKDGVKKQLELLFKRLGLEKAVIEIGLSKVDTFNKFGKDAIEILFQANAGFDLRPIQSAISGGERSRVMLAIKKIIAEKGNLPTLILDEIDTGVSGKVAEEMGLLMKDMGEKMQLIVISHLAQVAAKGSSNYKVVKEDIEGKTRSTILKLTEEQKLHEIAQLLSGAEVTEHALQQAKSLIK